MRSNKIKVLNTNVHAGDTNLVRAKDYNSLYDDVSNLYTGSVDDTVKDAMRGYRIYRAILKSNAESPPTTYVFEDTLDLNLIWSRATVGIFSTSTFNQANNVFALATLDAGTGNPVDTSLYIPIEIICYSMTSTVTKDNTLCLTSGSGRNNICFYIADPD